MERKTLQQVLDHDDFFHVAQPIINIIENKVFGYELLFRSNHIRNTEAFFQLAKQENRLVDVDIKSVKKALQTINQVHDQLNGIYWFINIQPHTLVHSAFIDQIKKEIQQKQLNPASIVFELNEDAKHVEINDLKNAVEQLRELGFLIALDDVGKAESSLQSILELEPNLIKIDRYFTSNLADSNKKKRFISIFTNLLEDELAVIFEGIENEADLKTLKQLGATFVQGYYLGKPEKLEVYLKTLN